MFRQTLRELLRVAPPIEIYHENPFNDNTTNSIFFPPSPSLTFVAQTFLAIKFCIKIPLPCSILRPPLPVPPPLFPQSANF